MFYSGSFHARREKNNEARRSDRHMNSNYVGDSLKFLLEFSSLLLQSKGKDAWSIGIGKQCTRSFYVDLIFDL